MTPINRLESLVPDVAGPGVAVGSGADGRGGPVVAAAGVVEVGDAVPGDGDVGGDPPAGVGAAVDGVAAAGQEVIADGRVVLLAEVLEEGDGVGLAVWVEDGVVGDGEAGGVPGVARDAVDVVGAGVGEVVDVAVLDGALADLDAGRGVPDVIDVQDGAGGVDVDVLDADLEAARAGRVRAVDVGVLDRDIVSVAQADAPALARHLDGHVLDGDVGGGDVEVVRNVEVAEDGAVAVDLDPAAGIEPPARPRGDLGGDRQQVRRGGYPGVGGIGVPAGVRGGGAVERDPGHRRGAGRGVRGRGRGGGHGAPAAGDHHRRGRRHC